MYILELMVYVGLFVFRIHITETYYD